MTTPDPTPTELAAMTDEHMLPYQLNELGTELHGLRDALWHAMRALNLPMPPRPESVSNPDRGPLTNRVATYAALAKQAQDIAHTIRGRLP